MLELEGVRATVVLTKEPGVYRGAALAGNARGGGGAAGRGAAGLAATPGVTVLIHDRAVRQRAPAPPEAEAAADGEPLRRDQRGGLRGLAATAERSPTACRSTGSRPSSARKTRVHASSCNQDLSCLGGDCPSFVTVETEAGTGYRRFCAARARGRCGPGARDPRSSFRAAVSRLPPGRRRDGRHHDERAPRLGGAHRWAGGAELRPDRGAAQKWGPVLSSLILARRDQEFAANKVGLGWADLYLALDLLAAGTRVNLDRCDPARTVAVVNASVLPSGEMVRDVNFAPPVAAIRAQIDRYTKATANVAVDARALAEGLFGDYMATNMLVLGVAYQAGLLPLTAAAVEQAIELNGVAVEQNRQAFRYGRLWAADPERVRALVDPPARSFETERAAALERLAGQDATAYVSLLDRCAHLDADARRMLAHRVGELIDYQDARVRRGVRGVRPPGGGAGDGDGTRARRGDPRRDPEPLQAHGVQGRVRGGAAPPGSRRSRGHAGALRRASPRHRGISTRRFSARSGLERKLRLGPWFRHALRALRAFRRLRGRRTTRSATPPSAARSAASCPGTATS